MCGRTLAQIDKTAVEFKECHARRTDDALVIPLHSALHVLHCEPCRYGSQRTDWTRARTFMVQQLYLLRALKGDAPCAISAEWQTCDDS